MNRLCNLPKRLYDWSTKRTGIEIANKRDPNQNLQASAPNGYATRSAGRYRAHKSSIYTADVEGCLLASYLLKSEGDVRATYSECNLIRNIHDEPRVVLFCGRNIITQGLTENTDSDYADNDILE